ncbi:MAG TPA: GH116 family glycosyl hydrolase [Phycisphaerae bacterium]
MSMDPCHEPDCCAGLNRREFIQLAGAGVASASLTTALSALAEPATQSAPVIQHFIRSEKGLASEWLRGLSLRGTRSAYRGEALETIGMPIGGIAAGQLYLLGDGALGCWQIFGQDYFSGYGADNYRHRKPDKPIEQGFAVALEREGEINLRRLNAEGFPAVEFTGQYPTAAIRYHDDRFPVEVELEAFSPFIPLNADDSCLPATLLHITLRNTSGENVAARIFGWLENGVCFHTASEVRGMRRSRIVTEKDRAFILHTAEEAPPDETLPRPRVVLADFEGEDYREWTISGEAFGAKPAAGTLPNQQPVSGFLGKGLVNTYLGGDDARGTLTSPEFVISRRFINFLVGGGAHADETCINLLIDGQIIRTATGRNNEKLEWHTWKVAVFEGRTARIEIVDRHGGGWGHINVDEIELADERRAGPTGPIEKLSDCGSLVLMLDGSAAPASNVRGVAAQIPIGAADWNLDLDVAYPIQQRRAAGLLTPAIKLAAGEQHTFTFVLAWHFPNRARGVHYAERFADAAAVAHYVLDHHARLAGETRRWRDTYYDCTLPVWLLDRIGATVSHLATGTCQRWANGRFWAWEGVGCCHGTCTHVWNYAQAPARLFPELERSVREAQDLGEAYHENGLVGFRGDNAYAADGQAGTVLKCYREHQMSADDAFLKRNWPKIKRALEYLIAQDGNDDGLIDASQPNTYDINFEGPNTFVGALYLAALRAGEQMAREVGETEFAARLRKIFESGSRLSVERLWNGEYFIQQVDLEKYPKDQYGDGCLSDQLFGQSWAHQLGIGYLYPAEHVHQALQAIWKYNWAPDIGLQNSAHKPERWFAMPGEAGLFVCTWPKSAYLPAGVRYREEVWTGIEYQVAAHMIWEGMVNEGLAIVRAVHDRYHPLKRNPYNEVECGDHYARALASWGVLTALAGYEYHGPRGYLAFAPRITPDDFRAAFTAAEGWGTFAQKRDGRTQRHRIEIHWGWLRLRTLALVVADDQKPQRVSVTVAGRPVDVTHEIAGNRVMQLRFGDKLILSAGGALEVELA